MFADDVDGTHPLSSAASCTMPDPCPLPSDADRRRPRCAAGSGARLPSSSCWQRDPRRPFLISAAPGAGKTRPALEFARTQLADGRASASRGRVPDGAADAPVGARGRPTRARSGPRSRLAATAGAASTASPSPTPGSRERPKRWAAALPRDTLVITDEAHHLGEELTWGEAFATAFAASDRRLLLSGTPFRSDATPIPGVSYDADGRRRARRRVHLRRGGRDGVCRPVRFVAYDGTLSWRSPAMT